MAARWIALGLALASQLACARSTSREDARPPRAQARVPAAQVVVVAEFDQLGAATLERWLPRLDPNGAIRTAIRSGARHSVAHAHAATYTAPGHATLHTGLAPFEHGIYANERWQEGLGEVSWLRDLAAPLLGDATASASPRALRAPTVADLLKEASGGAAKVVSVSVKDRGAVIPAGKRPDVALWYSADAKGFTTSRYYADALPSCVSEHAASHPIEQVLAPWLADPELARHVPDDVTGEGSYLGWSHVFPHEPMRASAPWSVLRLTPALTEYSLSLAETCARALALGGDDVPDLLLVSLSATDYAGHVFGPDSLEYVDALVRTDRALGRLMRSLEQRSRVALLISADHGATPLPETGSSGGRILSKEVVAHVNRELGAVFGPGEHARAFVAPFLALSDQGPARRGPRRAAAVRALSKLPGVFAAYDLARAAELRESRDPVERAVGLSVGEPAPGDVFVVPREGFIVDADMAIGSGTSHGSPWRDDTDVPVLITGANVRHLRSETRLDSRRVAPTIARLLGVPPATRHACALPGVDPLR